jgi:hypothetical protein
MNEPVVVCVLKSDRRLSHDFTRIGDTQWTAVIDNPSKVGSLDQFHDEEVLAIDGASIGCANDVRVVDLSDGAHFLSESGHRLLGPQFVARQDLKRDVLCQMDMNRLVNGAHSPFADLLQKAVIAQPLACFGVFVDIGRRGRISLAEPGSLPQLLELWFLEKAFGANPLAKLLQQIALFALKRR